MINNGLKQVELTDTSNTFIYKMKLFLKMNTTEFYVKCPTNLMNLT